MRQLRSLLPLALVLACESALGDQTAVPGVSGASFMQGILGLIFVIGLLLFAAWMMRKLAVGGALGNTQGMRVVAGLSVGPRERILLLEVGETWVVVGVTASQMRTLHTMAKGDLPAPAGGEPSGAFSTWLQRVVSERKNAAP